ncbi:acyltransferase family protein [Cupriavidus basilensis]
MSWRSVHYFLRKTISPQNSDLGEACSPFSRRGTETKVFGAHFGSGHIESLDCLRGISALLVMCYHYRELLNDIIPNIGNTIFENGRIGVDVFYPIWLRDVRDDTEQEESARPAVPDQVRLSGDPLSAWPVHYYRFIGNGGEDRPGISSHACSLFRYPIPMRHSLDTTYCRPAGRSATSFGFM